MQLLFVFLLQSNGCTDITIPQAHEIAATKENNYKLFKISDVRVGDFGRIFVFKYKGDVVHRSKNDQYMHEKGNIVQKPDTVMYNVKTMIKDNVGNPLWCTLFNSSAEKLFGIPAIDLFNQTLNLEPNNKRKNWNKQLIETVNQRQINLIIRCDINQYNHPIDQQVVVEKEWIVEQLEFV